jgi:hypothetical protein
MFREELHIRYEMLAAFLTGTTASLGPNRSPIQWVPGVKLPAREAEHSSPTRAEVRSTWVYTSTLPPYGCLTTTRDNFAEPVRCARTGRDSKCITYIILSETTKGDSTHLNPVHRRSDGFL